MQLIKASKLFLRAALIALLLVTLQACGGGGGGSSSSGTPPAQNPQPEEPPESTDAEDLAASLAGLGFDDLIATATPALALRDQESVVSLRLEDEYGLEEVGLSDISFAYRTETFDMWQAVKDALSAIDRSGLSPEKQLSYDVYTWLVDAQLAQREFMHYDYQASFFITGVPYGLELFFNQLHPLETVEDLDNYVIRLALVDNTLAQLRKNLVEMESQGIIEPAPTLRVSIDFHRAIAETEILSHVYYTSFSRALSNIDGIGIAIEEDYRAQVRGLITREVIPAYNALANALEEQLPRAPADIGVGQFPKGAAYYRERLAYHTSTDLTAEQIHQLGEQELARVHSEQRALFDQLGYPAGESLEQLYNRVAQDSGSIPANEILDEYDAIIADARQRSAALFERLPTTPVEVLGSGAGGLYVRAALDGSRPAIFYAGNFSPEPRYLMPSLAYHETLPGHHLQIALQQESDLPDFRRDLSVTGYTEGWALYAERLAGEEGWYENDIYGELGRLWYEGLRAARLVVDTGIHHYGWGFDQATNYFRESVGTDLGTAQANIARYSIYTGQATAYMVGMLEILEMRERARQAQGGSFNLPAFHSLVLDQGALPLPLLEQHLENQIPGF